MSLKALPPDLLEGKTVFVTGGGGGINFAIAKSYAEVGAQVAICGRNPDRLATAAAELQGLGARVSTTVADVRDDDALEAAFSESLDRLGPADVVVAGAAGNFLLPAEDLSSKGFRTVMEIDLLGSFHTARCAFAQLRQTRGSLLFVSAAQAQMPFMYQAHVGAAKAGIDNLMRNLALEWGRHGIRCNSIVPGPIEDTEGMRRLAASGREAWERSIPLGRFGRGEEIGAMAVILGSPLAAYVTGARIEVDGGLGLSGSGLLNEAMGAAMEAQRRDR